MSYRKEGRLADVTIREALRPFGVVASDELVEKISLYLETLLIWNQKVNLTSITQPSLILRRHFGESFFAAIALNISKGRLADVGSGAGFPGLALKLLRSELELTLIEPNIKKATFLAEIIRKLGLTGIRVLRLRYEQIRPTELPVDWITARALGNYVRLLSWARGVLKKGRVILWANRSTAEELEALDDWSFISPILIPESIDRFLVCGSPK